MKKKEYLDKSKAFRGRIIAESKKATPDFPEDWMTVEVIATCTTPGCPREGLSHKLNVSEPADGVYKVLCAPCNSPVTELDPQLEDDKEYRLPVRDAKGKSWMR